MDKNSISKNLITLVILDLDYCTRTFGVAPCTATGTKCYNTFKTCKDKTNYNKTTKEYRYINNSAPAQASADLNALPYVLENSPLSTELRDDKTIPARGTITFADEEDYDQGIDPYWEDRRSSLIEGVGTHFKKLIERNPYYKGRIITIKQGYTGQAEGSFETIFSGKIQNITREGRNVKLEYSDDLVDLSKIEYPYKTNIEITDDVGACYECANEEAMLNLTAVLGDFALRRDFININVYLTPGYAGSLADGAYSYFVVGYTAENVPIASGGWSEQISGGYNSMAIDFDLVTGCTYYRIFGREATDLDHYLQQNDNTQIIDDGSDIFTVDETFPVEAERYFELINTPVNDKNNWSELSALPTIPLSSVSGLESSGYIQINDEVIFYGAISVLNLTGVKRIQYKTKTKNHYTGTNIKLVEWATPGNPFTLLKTRLQRAGIPDGRIDITTIDAYAAAYSGINYSTKAIIKSTNAAKLIFDLVNVLDISLWVNEEGKVTCKKNTETTVDHTIDEASNIILDSQSVDFNHEDIKTRINLYWNRFDVTKGADDKENYGNLHIEIDADAEGANMYDESLPETITTTWINDDCGTDAAIASAMATLCNNKLKRKREPRPKLTFEVEQKDSAIKVGNIVQLSSSAFNDIDGEDYQNKSAQVIKKTHKGLKIELTVKLLATDAVSTSSEDHVVLFDDPKPVNEFALNEIKVTGLKVVDLALNEYTTDALSADVDVKVHLEWDNMYASTEESATDINGVTRELAKTMVYTGNPPHPSSIITDLSSWKTVKRYKVYMFIADAGQTTPAVKRPTTSEANGDWYVVGYVNDLKSTDVTKKYKFDFNLPINLVGRYVGFDVYADANIVYDPDAPIGIEVGELK